MMKFSQKWLQDWLDIEIPTEQLVEQLTMAGLEVDHFGPVAGDFSQVIIGEVVDMRSHPQADKLNICEVNTGTETVTVVCGAPNVYPGMKAPFAMIGALISGIEIKKVRLRGVESFGMLCSSKELGLSEEHAKGLLEFPEDAPVGMDVRAYLQLDDVVIDVELTSDRGDCASIRGIAREVATLNRCHYLEPKIDSIWPVIEDTFSIHLINPEACPRYVGRIIRDVDMKAVTPIWMQERLRRSGIHSIHPIVDVTNYVLLELGHPMHAFDLDKLSGEIRVRFANPNEKLMLLKDEEVVLSPDTLVIADENGPLAIAGVMGGKFSGITEETNNIFLESAFFNPVHIINRARQYGFQTDASYRFEHGVDPALQVQAMERATQLLLAIVGGTPGPVLEAQKVKFLPQRKQIDFRVEKVERLLGIKVSMDEIFDILQRLGMQINRSDQHVWRVEVPSHRFDVSIEEDLVGEVVRIYGYNNLPRTAVKADLRIAPAQKTYHQYKHICNLLSDLGYHEVITYSFIDSDDQKKFDAAYGETVSLINPMVKDMSTMRSNLWPGLVKVLSYNLNRQQNRVRLFETGLRFYYRDQVLVQEEVLSGLLYGELYEEQWGSLPRLVDFFDVKSDIESILNLTGQPNVFSFRTDPKHTALHPGQSAALFLNDQVVGFVGMLHPQIVQDKGIEGSVYVFEMKLSAIQETVIPSFSSFSKFPVVRRDLAFVVDQAISSAEMCDEIKSASGALLIDLVIFDVYQGENILQGQKSIAFRLTLQHAERTLQDVEVDERIAEIIKRVESKFGGKLR